MRFLTLSLVAAIFSLSFALPSYASSQNVTEEPGFTMAPVPTSDPAVTANGYFVYKLKNSATITGSVLLKNPTDKMLTIELAAVDAITAQKGGSAFETSEVEPKMTATWLKFAESSVTLQVGMQKQVDFTVTVPQSTKPGQYLAGISAYVPTIPPTADPRTSGQLGAGVIMQTRYVIGVQVDVQGSWTPSLKIENVALVQQPSGPFIGVTMKNGGDEFLKPSGSIVMTDTVGKRVLDQPIEMGTFIPGTGVVYPVHWSGVMTPGMYHVHVRLAYAKTGIVIYDSPLEISAASVVKVAAVATQAPGVIGSTQAPVQSTVTAQVPDESGKWLLVLGSAGLLLLAIIAVLAFYMAKTRRLRAQSEEF
jgi:hypothetical protein